MPLRAATPIRLSVTARPEARHDIASSVVRWGNPDLAGGAPGVQGTRAPELIRNTPGAGTLSPVRQVPLVLRPPPAPARAPAIPHPQATAEVRTSARGRHPGPAGVARPRRRTGRPSRRQP